MNIKNPRTFPLLLVAATAGALLAVGALGCSKSAGPHRIAHRVIETDPHRLFDPAAIGVEKTVARWRLGRGKEVRRWRIEGLEARSVRNEMRRFRVTGRAPSLERDVESGTGPIHLVRAEVVGLKKGELTLDWADRGQDFHPSRSMTIAWSRSKIAESGGFLFDLSRHPRWTGEPERLRLRPRKFAAEIVRIGRVELLRREVASTALNEIVDTAWKVELANEVRPAILGHPDRPRQSTVEIESTGTRLRFSYGLQRGIDTAVDFTVTVIDGAATETVFEDGLRPPKEKHPGWSFAEIDLSAWTGRRVELRFTVSSRQPLDLFQGLPVWGSPELIEPTTETDRPNVLLICLDTLRADRLSSYGHFRPTSPEIDEWASSRAVRFANVVAPAPWTLPSHTSYFSGIEALAHGTNHRGAAPPELEMMAETLRHAGYTTAAITGGGILRPKYGFTQGFDSFAYWPDKRRRDELAWGYDRLESWLGSHSDEPFFLFFHTYETHYPFFRRQPHYDRLTENEDPPLPRSEVRMLKHGWDGLRYPGDYLEIRHPGSSGWRLAETDLDKRVIGALYDSGVAYADAVVGKILDLVHDLEAPRPTLIILVSDHGEALGEENRAGHSYLEDYNTMVPMLIELPDGRGAGTVISDQVRLIDMLPTVLEAIGLDHDHVPHGSSLLPLIGGNHRHPEEAWSYSPSNNRGVALRIGNRLKYLYNDSAWDELAGEERLVDLIADPDETGDLAATDELTTELRQRTQHEVDDLHAGYRLLIRNPGDGVLSGVLRGAWADVSRIKIRAPGCLRLSRSEEKDAVFEAGPGCEATLFFAGLPSTEVEIEASVIGGGRRGPILTETVDLDLLERPLDLHLDGGRWRRSDVGETIAGTGFTIWWHGLRPRHSDNEQATDPSLVDQLRALGYVE